MTKLLFGEETYAVLGAAIEVHREMGSGFLEAVYQEAMEIELADRKIPFDPRRGLAIRYKDRLLRKAYEVDLVCYERIIVELKALDRLSGKEEAQILHYLKASGMRLGLLINFGSHGRLEWKRYIL
jgi:GxxExxY protein